MGNNKPAKERAEVVKAVYNALITPNAQTPTFDLKTAQKSLETATGPQYNGLSMLQIEVIADHFNISVREIEEVLGI